MRRSAGVAGSSGVEATVRFEAGTKASERNSSDTSSADRGELRGA